MRQNRFLDRRASADLPTAQAQRGSVPSQPMLEPANPNPSARSTSVAGVEHRGDQARYQAIAI
jgi:hypothetical protein